MRKVTTMKHWLLGVSLMILGGGMSACAMGGTSWKEEVLLHDGKMLIVERSQARGGRHEIGQEVPVTEHVVLFRHPSTGKAIQWKSEYGIEAEKWSLLPLALDILNGTPYIVSTPVGCIAYNKWGRPNPPYVIQKFDGTNWERIALALFPKQITEANLVIGGLTGRTERRLTTGRSGPVPTKEIKDINTEAHEPAVQYLRAFVRVPLKPGSVGVSCPDYSSPRYMSPKAPNQIGSSPKEVDSNK